MKRLIFLLVIVCTSLVLADKKFDPVTGRDTRNYPPDPQVNFSHIALDIRMPDPMSKSFTCDETIRFSTPQRSIDHVDLDAVELKIDAVTDLEGAPLKFRHDDRVLTVRFSPPLKPQTKNGIRIHYACSNPKEGMIFALPDEQYHDRPLQIHTQGEAESNRYWFVSHDYPNAKQTSEISVTIPSKYQALSNGALVSRDDAGNGLVRYHYKLGQPHVSYLVSLVIGEFAVLKEEWRGKPVEYWVPPSQEANAKRTFGKTPEMLEVFSKLTHFDYPWEKYAQAVVYNFEAGGMENTSCTTLVESTTLDERGALDSDFEGLISHELAHQWFGDTVTCKSWPHTWINEGFATFMDAAWHEHAHGRTSYEHQIWRSMQGVAESDDPTARDGIAHYYYDDPWEVFGRRISNPYGKGSCVIHALRQSLGDELFWNCVGTFLERNAFKSVETDDLRKVCDELSGRSYERFFQQWIYRAGTPKIKVSYEWNDRNGEVRLAFEQTQTINESSPAFDVEFPVEIDGTAQMVRMRDRRESVTIKSASEPGMVAIDPNGSALAKWELDLPESKLIAQAKGGPTPFARYNAIAALGNKDRDDAREALQSILFDAKQDASFREEAAAALGRMHHDAARDILLAAVSESETLTEPHARRAVIEALGGYRGEKVVAALLRFAKSDETYGVEAAATEALGKQDGTDEIVEQLVVNASKPAYRDQIRSNALRALGDLADPRGMKPAKQLAAYGNPGRLRPVAIETVAKIARQLPDAEKESARKFLVALIDDPQQRSSEAAMSALGSLGDDKSIASLQSLANSASQRRRDAAKNAIDAINGHQPGETGSVRALRERIEVLEKAREESDQVQRDSKHGNAPTTAP